MLVGLIFSEDSFTGYGIEMEAYMKTLTFLTFFSAFSYLFFGWACVSTSQMKSEFRRYGLANYRKILGILQFLGAMGLIIGFFYLPPLQAIAAVGLSILMVLGYLVRLIIRDSFIQSAPSLLYSLLNAYIFYSLFPLL